MSRNRIVGFLACTYATVVSVEVGGGNLRAQVPNGWYVTTHGKMCREFPWLADGRIRVIDPDTGAATLVSGVPDELLSRPCQGEAQGAEGVLVRPEDGAILVGEGSHLTESVDIFLLELEEFAVRRLTRFPVGSVDGKAQGNVDQMEFLPDGRVLFSLQGVAPGWFGVLLGILDLSAAEADSVNLVRVAPPTPTSPMIMQGMAVDLERGSVYLAEAIDYATSNIGQVWLADVLAAAGSDTPIAMTYIAAVPMAAQSLAMLPDGRLLAVGLGTQSGLFAIDPEDGSRDRVCRNVPDTDSDAVAVCVDSARAEVLVHFDGPVNSKSLQGKTVAFSAPGGDWNDCWMEIRATSWADSQGLLADIAVSSWQAPPAFRRGDSNADGAADISDAVTILGFLFLGEPMNDCADAADVNDDAKVDISDAVSLLDHLFRGMSQPPEPYGACGGDPTHDDLDCKTFEECAR